MKKRLLLGLAPAVLLLFSCGGNNKTTTAITKINLSGAKTLVMGTLKSSSNEDTSDTEGTLISVDEDANATETSVVVSDGTSTTQVASIQITRLVKLNKEYAVVSALYNDATYDLIVNLTDGTCVKFPDSNMLPNVKQKLGGHKKYRKYFKKFGYLNNEIIQPNEESNIFYYINSNTVTSEDGTTKEVRRLIKLDLVDTNAPATYVVVEPDNNYSVQSFAINSNEDVVYFATKNSELSGDDPLAGITPKFYSYTAKITLGVTPPANYTIKPFLYTGEDGIVYCFIEDSYKKYQIAKITVDDEESPTAVNVVSISSEESSKFDELPTKIFNIKTSVADKVISVSSTLKSKFSEILSFKAKNETRSFKPGGGGHKPGQSGKELDDSFKPKKEVETISGSQSLDEITDGFSGKDCGYLYGKKGDGNRLLKVKYNNDDNCETEIISILNKYFTSTTEISEIEADESSEDNSTTIVVEDSNETSSVVVIDDTTEQVEEVDVTNVSEVVDVNS